MQGPGKQTVFITVSNEHWGVEKLEGLFAQQRSELPLLKATLYFLPNKKQKKNALSTSM